MENSEEKKYIGVIDLCIFVVLLLVSSFTGIFFAYRDRRRISTRNYFFGDKSMSPIIVGISSAVTFLSAITVIGVPAETYIVGTASMWYPVSLVVVSFLAAVYFIPAIYRLQLTSIYEFLELRFSKRVRLYFAFTESLSTIFYMATTVYLPSLAISAVCNISLAWSIAFTSVICTFYTSLGGLKAVLWTDAVQALVMLIGSLAVFIQVLIKIGGFKELSASLERGERFNFFSSDFDINSRKSGTAVFIGWFMSFMMKMGCSQEVVQRYLSCRNERQAKWSVVIFLLPACMIATTAVCNGLAMYAYFEGCDPVKSGKLFSLDQGMPHIALEVFQDLPGLTGLFIAAIASGSLSTVSSAINSLSVVLLNDFALQVKPDISEQKKLLFGRITTIIFGFIIAIVSYIVMSLQSNIIQISFSVVGVLTGPLMGIYFLGFFTPWATPKGVFAGVVSCYAFMAWITIGSTYFLTTPPDVKMPPILTNLCSNNESVNIDHQETTITPEVFETLQTQPIMNRSFDQIVYSISFLYYKLFGFLITAVVGLLFSLATGANNPGDMDPKLFIPLIDNKLLPKMLRSFFRFGVPEIPTEKRQDMKLLPATETT